MINTLQAFVKYSLVCITLFIAACSESQPPAPAGINLSAPTVLLNTKRVVEDQLRPIVVLSDGQTVNMFKSSDQSGWTGTTTVVSNQTYDISITWIERYLDTDLPLANLSERFSVGSDAHVLTIEQSSYNTNLDFDNDGISNLQERLDDSDPYSAEDGTGGTTGGDTGNDDGDTGDDSDTVGGDDDTGTTGGDGTDTGNTDGNGTGGTGTGGTGTGGTGTGGTGTGGTDTGGTDTGGTSDVTVLIPFIDSDDAPEIDGEITLNNNNVAGAWSNAVSSDIGGTPLGINNLMVDINADHDDDLILRRWWAMHDGDYLYILVLSDDTGLRFSDSDRAWHDDSLEVYIDGDNSKLQAYGDDDDIQITIPLQPLNSNDSNESDDSDEGRFSLGSGSTNASANIDFATGIGNGPDGLRVSRWEQDIYELRISLDSVGIAVGRAFGFELQINDDDDGGEREGKWGWFHPERDDEDVDFTYLNPSIMGTVILQ